jgi:hypothetical protein
MKPAASPLPAASRRRPLWGALAACLAVLVWAAPALAEAHQRLAAPQGVAVGGFDPVAYFIDGRAQPGAPDIALRWRGVVWHFTTPAHRAAFEADPKAYLPQFGGFCALSVAEGRPVPASPEHWVLFEGRLYMARSAAALAQFLADPQPALQAARANWPPRPSEIAGGGRTRN